MYEGNVPEIDEQKETGTEPESSLTLVPWDPPPGYLEEFYPDTWDSTPMPEKVLCFANEPDSALIPAVRSHSVYASRLLGELNASYAVADSVLSSSLQHSISLVTAGRSLLVLHSLRPETVGASSISMVTKWTGILRALLLLRLRSDLINLRDLVSSSTWFPLQLVNALLEEVDRQLPEVEVHCTPPESESQRW